MIDNMQCINQYIRFLEEKQTKVKMKMKQL